jgi:DNA-binding protein H-NS
MSKLAELIAQRQELEDRIAALKAEEGENALTQIRAIIAEYGFTADQVFGRAKGAKAKSDRAPVAAKYRHPVTGSTWSGRGKAPRWIAGQDRDKFAI